MDEKLEILCVKDLEKILKISKSTMLRWRHSGDFPEPMHLGGRSVRWTKKQIDTWILSLHEENVKNP